MLSKIGLGIWEAALGGGAFSPVSLFGGGEQGVVYDLTNTATMFQERTGAAATTPSGANGPIGTLKDLSPNNNYAVTASDVARPLSRQGVGAPNVYGEWDGIDDYLRATFVIAQPFVRVASWRRITGITSDQVFGGVFDNSGVLFRGGGSNTEYSIFDGLSLGTITVALGENIVSTERHNNTLSRIAKNNGAYVSGTSGSNVPGGVTLCSNSSLSAFLNVALYRVIIISRDLTDSEIAQCRTWCGAAAGLML